MDTHATDRDGLTARDVAEAVVEQGASLKNGTLTARDVAAAAAAAARCVKLFSAPSHMFANYAMRANAAYKGSDYAAATADYGRAEALLEKAEELLDKAAAAPRSTAAAKAAAKAAKDTGKVAGVTAATRATFAFNHGRAATRLLPSPSWARALACFERAAEMRDLAIANAAADARSGVAGAAGAAAAMKDRYYAALRQRARCLVELHDFDTAVPAYDALISDAARATAALRSGGGGGSGGGGAARSPYQDSSDSGDDAYGGGGGGSAAAEDGGSTAAEWRTLRQAAKSKTQLSHYETLEVARDATSAVIKRAYHKLSLKWHPDRHSDEDGRVRATNAFQRIAAAYATLSEAAARKTYDLQNPFARGFTPPTRKAPPPPPSRGWSGSVPTRPPPARPAYGGGGARAAPSRAPPPKPTDDDDWYDDYNRAV